MSTNYDGNPASFPAHVRLVDDGEPASAAYLGLCSQDLADRTAFLYASLSTLITGPLASMNALKAVDTTSLADGAVRLVARVGIYVLQKPEINAGKGRAPWKIVPTTGTGVWLLCDEIDPVHPGRIFPLTAVSVTAGPYAPGAEATAIFNAGGTNGADNYAQRTGSGTRQYSLALADGTNIFGMSVALDPYLKDGRHLLNVRLNVNSFGGTYPAGKMPTLGVYRKKVDAAIFTDLLVALKATGGALATDASASDAAFAAAHQILYTCDQNNNIDLNTYTYEARIFDLANAAGKAQANYAGMQVEYTNV